VYRHSKPCLRGMKPLYVGMKNQRCGRAQNEECWAGMYGGIVVWFAYDYETGWGALLKKRVDLPRQVSSKAAAHMGERHVRAGFGRVGGITEGVYAVLAGAPNRSAIRTSSGNEPAFILRMTCPR
jgi:hypothetical protein